ncbi:MAG: TonB-dependent receptor [Bacteroidota bacterium]
MLLGKTMRALVLMVWMLPAGLWAQDHVQVIRGKVTDAYTGAAIGQASVTITNTVPPKAVFSDSKGRFSIEGVPTGRVFLQVAQQGYEMLALPDLVLNEGKELVLETKLKPITYTTGEVEIKVPALTPISARSISVEETKRFAAVYFDPARVATSLPGVVQADDGANHLVVRGNSPNGVLWRLEGIDILNPNHLSNAGTLSDRATAAGGGTNILSTQLLGNSTFTTSAYGAQYGNALGGVFDISLRPGNDQQYEFTAQAGFIGVDLSAEGPFSRNRKASFLINYRYSFTGLLSLMGVPLGDEDIRFQDLAFNLNFPTRKLGTFTVFGMGGLSSNVFTGPREDSLVTFQKDRFDIDYRSDMGAAGITHKVTLGEKTLWKTAVGLSALLTSWDSRFILDNGQTVPTDSDRLEQSRISLTTSLKHAVRNGLYLKVGGFANRIDNEVRTTVLLPGTGVPPTAIADGNENAWLVQPYAELDWRPIKALELRAGLHAMHFTLNGSQALEPRFNAHLRIDNRQSVQAAVGWHSQVQLPGTYFASFLDSLGDPQLFNRDLGLSRARHYVLNYDRYLGTHFRARIEGYYQDLYNIPIVNDPNSTVSALNQMEGYLARILENAGTGRNYGLELNVERLLYRNYYFLFSGTLYRSLYTAGDGVERASRFDGRFATVTSGGYEWSRESRKGKQQIFGINARVVYRGGLREMPIDLAASRQAARTVYDDAQGFTEQLPDYFRVDVRFTFKRNRPGYTSTLGIDLQNVTNAQNIGWRFYDARFDSVLTRLQLGLIPLLSYRMEF